MGLPARVPRPGIRRPVRFYRIDELVCAYTDDLSERGAFVHTDAWLPVNGVVDLCVVLPKDSPIVLRSRVAYCLPPDQARILGRRSGIGFQFLAGDVRTRGRLRACVRDAAESLEPERALRRRVLLACANPRLEKRLTHALLPAGFELGTAPTSLELLECLAEEPWDALVLDEALGAAARLPQLAGDVSRPLPPLLLVASGHDEMARLRAYRAGVSDCLPRPFTDEELRLRLRQLLRQARRKPTPDIAGTLARMPVTSVLALIEHERRTGVLTLESTAGAIAVSLRNGGVAAVDGRLDGGARHRLLGALAWREGHFEFRTQSLPVESLDTWPVSGLLLDCARLEDERRRV